MVVVIEGQAYRLHAEAARPFLQQNAPNPFNASTVISFQIPANMAGPTRLVIYNLTGQIVRVLTDSHLAPGAHALAWDGRDGRWPGDGQRCLYLPLGRHLLRHHSPHDVAAVKSALEGLPATGCASGRGRPIEVALWLIGRPIRTVVCSG